MSRPANRYPRNPPRLIREPQGLGVPQVQSLSIRETLPAVPRLDVIEGDGIVKDIKNEFHRRVDLFKQGPRKGPPRRFTDFLDETADKKIVSIKVGRKPVLKPIQKALNYLSLGGYEKMKKKLKYDDTFHNFLLVELSDGTRVKLEKNHVVEFFPARSDDYKAENYSVPVSKDLNLKEMIQNASDGDDKFWRYSAAHKNCQDFTTRMITKNELVPDKPVIVENQDASKIIDTLPGGALIPNLVTDTAASLDRAVYGDGRFQLTF